MRRRLASALALLAVTLLLGCGEGSGTTDAVADALPQGRLMYPGATLVDEDFLPEDDDISIDGSDMSNAARLDLDYELAEPTAVAEVYRWSEEQLAAQGFAASDESSVSRTFRKEADGELHVVIVQRGDEADPIASYSVHYWSGVQER